MTPLLRYKIMRMLWIVERLLSLCTVRLTVTPIDLGHKGWLWLRCVAQHHQVSHLYGAFCDGNMVLQGIAGMWSYKVKVSDLIRTVCCPWGKAMDGSASQETHLLQRKGLAVETSQNVTNKAVWNPNICTKMWVRVHKAAFSKDWLP